MMEKIKGSLAHGTVKIAVAALLIILVCWFLPVMGSGKEAISMLKLVSEETEYFPAIMPLFFFGVFWAAAMFLFNHPRLAFIGIAALGIMWIALMPYAFDEEERMAFGYYLWGIALDVAAVMSIEIKKDRRNKEKAA